MGLEPGQGMFRQDMMVSHLIDGESDRAWQYGRKFAEGGRNGGERRVWKGEVTSV